MNITNVELWGTTPYGLAKSLRGFGGASCFHRHNRQIDKNYILDLITNYIIGKMSLNNPHQLSSKWGEALSVIKHIFGSHTD